MHYGQKSKAPRRFRYGSFRRWLGTGWGDWGVVIEIAEVATDAGVWGIGIVAVVAGVAVVGNRNVRPVERVERIQEEGVQVLSVAIRTSGWELRGEVVRVGSTCM